MYIYYNYVVPCTHHAMHAVRFYNGSIPPSGGFDTASAGTTKNTSSTANTASDMTRTIPRATTNKADSDVYHSENSDVTESGMIGLLEIYPSVCSILEVESFAQATYDRLKAGRLYRPANNWQRLCLARSVYKDALKHWLTLITSEKESISSVDEAFAGPCFRYSPNRRHINAFQYNPILNDPRVASMKIRKYVERREWGKQESRKEEDLAHREIMKMQEKIDSERESVA